VSVYNALAIVVGIGLRAFARIIPCLSDPCWRGQERGGRIQPHASDADHPISTAALADLLTNNMGDAGGAHFPQFNAILAFMACCWSAGNWISRFKRLGMSPVLLILILLLLFGGGGGYYAYGPYGGVGIGGIFLIILIVLLLTGRL
jgi:hypothetical protein